MKIYSGKFKKPDVLKLQREISYADSPHMNQRHKEHFKAGLYTLVFVKDGGKILLLKRLKEPNAGKYNGVGGKVEPTEGILECALRETKEETGLNCLSLQLKLVLRFVEERGLDYCVFAYLCDDFTGILQECEEGALEWVDKPLEKELVENIPVFLPYLLEQNTIGDFHFLYAEDGSINYSFSLNDGRQGRGEISQ